ncbi:MAG TPA: hypothetical protein VF961_05665 [Pyrinomonadaceae bacterium]
MKHAFYILVLVFPVLLSTVMQNDSCSSKKNAPTTPPAKSTEHQPEQPGAMPQTSRLPSGSWGGMHIALEVGASSATFEFDCAHGVVTEPILLDKDGRFDVIGSYVVEGPGPVREGKEKGSNARYLGTVHDDTITLKVKPDGSDGIDFSLILGKSGKIHKCY